MKPQEEIISEMDKDIRSLIIKCKENDYSSEDLALNLIKYAIVLLDTAGGEPAILYGLEIYAGFWRESLRHREG